MPTPDDTTTRPEHPTLAEQVTSRENALTELLRDVPRCDDIASGLYSNPAGS